MEAAEIMCMVCKAPGPEPIGVEMHPLHVMVTFGCEACGAVWQIQIHRDELEDETLLDLVILTPGREDRRAS